MRWLRLFLASLLLSSSLCVPRAAQACPACAEAIAAAADTGEEGDFPKAMNQSIYLMIAVPYTTLAVGSFFVYRGLKKRA